jgi:DNA-binding MarR family transcriptional regulator
MRASRGESAASLASDELIDELDGIFIRIGRVMASRHAGPEHDQGALSMAQALVLRALAQHGAMKMSDVAALLSVKLPAASSAISALERGGYVSRSTDAEDRRITLVEVTDAGRTVLHAAEECRRVAMRRYLSILPEEDIRALIRIHRTLMTAIDEGRV